MAAVVLSLFAWLAPPVTSNDYMDALKGKHRRLQELSSPKVIIMGGSNVAFGLDSEELEKALCMPVVNMGLHASLGTEFMINEVKNAIGPGDLVLLSLEYSNLRAPRKMENVLYLAVDRDPSVFQWVPLLQRPQVVLSVVVLRLQALWKQITGKYRTGGETIYRAENFDVRGDMVGHHANEAKARKPLEGLHYVDVQVHPHTWDLLLRLKKRVEEKGGRSILLWPSIAASAYDEPTDWRLAAEFTQHRLPLLGSREEQVYPDERFLDTRYHLDKEGRRIRTLRTVDDLCESYPDLCCRK
jgi:hypothetical protein